MEASTDELRCPPVSSLLKSFPVQLCSFKPATIQEVTSVIKKSSTASYTLDPIPTGLLNDVLPVLAPVITEIVNASLAIGIFLNLQ